MVIDESYCRVTWYPSGPDSQISKEVSLIFRMAKPSSATFQKDSWWLIELLGHIHLPICPQFLLILDVILPGVYGQDAAFKQETGDLFRIRHVGFVMEKMEDFWSRVRKSLLDLSVTSHILPILTIRLMPKESIPLLLDSFGMISFKPWLAHPALVGEPPRQCGVVEVIAYLLDLMTIRVCDLVWGPRGWHLLPALPWFFGVSFRSTLAWKWVAGEWIANDHRWCTNGLFLFITEYFRGYQFVWKLVAFHPCHEFWQRKFRLFCLLFLERNFLKPRRLVKSVRIGKFYIEVDSLFVWKELMIHAEGYLTQDDQREKAPYLQKLTTEEDHIDHQLEMNLFANHAYISTIQSRYIQHLDAFSVHVIPIISIISLMYYYIHTHTDILIHT